MQIFKKILYGIGALIVLFLFVAAFTPREYTISVTTTINKPKQVVYDYVKLLKNQEQYSVWVMEDPKTKLSYGGTDGTVGASQSWESDISGQGTQTIIAMTDERMDVDLSFVKPMVSQAKAANIIKAISENQTALTSEFYGSDPYPSNFMGYWIGGSFIKDSETKNLANLKAILEK